MRSASGAAEQLKIYDLKKLGNIATTSMELLPSAQKKNTQCSSTPEMKTLSALVKISWKTETEPLP